MSHPTPSQYQRARALFEQNRQLNGQIATLRNLIEAARIVASSHAGARSQRLMLASQPGNLAGLIELNRRTDPATVRDIHWRYRSLLAEMHDGHPMGGKPLKVDFNALPLNARPYLLAPYLKLSVGGVFPRLDLDRSDVTAGTLTFIVTGGPVDLAAWLPHLEKASAWLGGHWSLTAHTATTVTLTRRQPLPDELPFTASYLRHGALFTGIDITTYQPAYIPFSEMTSGTFIPGVSGTGKSNALHILIQSLFANLDLFTHIYLVDGKDGVAFNRYAGRHPKITVLWDEPDLWKLTSTLVATMRERNAAQRQAGTDKATKDFIAVVIDEMSTYTAKPSSDGKSDANKAHARFIDELAILARRGRSTGLRLIITAQEPTENQIPTTVRSNCLTTIAFRMQVDAHATAVFGSLDGLPADPRQLKRGRALVKQGLSGTLDVVQFPLIPPNPRGRA